jgi:hypothetical protein
MERVYEGPCNGPLAMYNLNSSKGILSAGPVSSTQYGYPGLTPSLSANGAVNGIVWAFSEPIPP